MTTNTNGGMSNGVAMDSIENQLGAVERRWTRDDNDGYDCNYLDNRGNYDDNDDGRGDCSR